MTTAFSIGIIVALIILSIKTGIILATSWLKKRDIFLASAVFGVMLFVVSILVTPFTIQVIQLTEKYTFPASLIMAGLFIYLGLNEQDGCCDKGNKQNKNRANYIAVFLPCPFCIIAMALSIILFKQQLGIETLILDLVISAIFFLVLVIVALGMRWLMSKRGSYPGKEFNAVLLLVGIVTVALSLLIPNFVNAVRMDFSPIRIESGYLMLWVLIVFSTLLVLGYVLSYLKRSNIK